MEGCIVTVEGDYFSLASDDGRKKNKKRYKIEARVASPDGALSLIKNKLLNRILAKQYPDFHTFRTHEITQITDLNRKPLIGYTNVRLMDFNQIAAYVKDNRLPLRLELYTDLGTLRQMVFLAETNKKEFAIKQSQLEKEVKEDKLLAELNPDLFDGVDVHIPEVNIVNTEPKINEDKKVEQVYIKGRGYVPVDEFEEDFNVKGEEPYGADLDIEDGAELVDQL